MNDFKKLLFWEKQTVEFHAPVEYDVEEVFMAHDMPFFILKSKNYMGNTIYKAYAQSGAFIENVEYKTIMLCKKKSLAFLAQYDKEKVVNAIQSQIKENELKLIIWNAFVEEINALNKSHEK